MFQKLVLTISILLSCILVSITAVSGESNAGGETAYLPLVARPSVPITQLAHLLPPDPIFEGQFGYAVDIDGSIAAVTTYPRDDQFPTSNSGTLYIYEQLAPGSWSLRGQFTSDGVDEYDWYGISVAVSGTTVVVGASRDDEFGSNTGAVYIYEKVGSSWQEVDKFAANDSTPNDDFGIAVTLEGNTLIVGSLFHAVGGAAYAFEKNGGTWQQVAQFLPELPDFLDFFGAEVVLSQNTLAVGMPYEGECPGDDECGAGAVYIYQKDANGWNTNGVKLRPQALLSANRFGGAIALKGNVLSIGEATKSYVFEKNGGGIWQEITALDGDGDGQTGGSTAIIGNYIITGEGSTDSAGSNAGAIFLFAKNQNGIWQQVSRFTPAQATNDDHFGQTVAAANDFFIVGVPRDDTQFADAGSAFILSIGP